MSAITMYAYVGRDDVGHNYVGRDDVGHTSTFALASERLGPSLRTHVYAHPHSVAEVARSNDDARARVREQAK